REPPSEAVSFAVWVASAHPEPGFTNRYAAPCSVLAATVARSAPATTVPPEIATDNPNTLTEAPSEAVNIAGWVPSAHPERGLTNTYAAPCSRLPPTVASGAPATTVPPEIATDEPKLSPSTMSEAVNLAVSVASAHPERGLTNTYAAPR